MGDWYIVYGVLKNDRGVSSKHVIVCAKTVAEAKSKAKDYVERHVWNNFTPSDAFRLNENEVYE